MENSVLQWLAQQSGIVIILLAGGWFAWAKVFPFFTATQEEFKANLKQQITEERTRARERTDEFLHALHQVTARHADALDANTQAIAKLTNMVETKIKRPPARKMAVKKAVNNG